MSYELETFDIQGVRFKMKPTSPRNVRAVQNMDPDDFDVSEEDDPIIANAKMHLDLLGLFAEPIRGDVEDIDPEELDIGKVTHYFRVFTRPLSGT